MLQSMTRVLSGCEDDDLRIKKLGQKLEQDNATSEVSWTPEPNGQGYRAAVRLSSDATTMPYIGEICWGHEECGTEESTPPTANVLTSDGSTPRDQVFTLNRGGQISAQE